jgi:SAM-dependent methyltransferase
MSARAHEAYGQHGSTFVDRFGVWLSQSAIRRYLPPGNELEIIEMGCGYRAKLLVGLHDRVKRGVGVDFQVDPALRELPAYQFFEGSIEETLPKLAGQTFDVVMLISVLEHLAEPLAALEFARGLLKPGGVLLVNVPTWRGKFFLEFSAFRLGLSPKVEMDDHKMYYDKRDLWPLLVKAGFLPSAIRLRYHKFGLNLFAVARRAHA